VSRSARSPADATCLYPASLLSPATMAPQLAPRRPACPAFRSDHSICGTYTGAPYRWRMQCRWMKRPVAGRLGGGQAAGHVFMKSMSASTTWAPTRVTTPASGAERLGGVTILDRTLSTPRATSLVASSPTTGKALAAGRSSSGSPCATCALVVDDGHRWLALSDLRRPGDGLETSTALPSPGWCRVVDAAWSCFCVRANTTRVGLSPGP
jgi:hypothetical protein